MKYPRATALAAPLLLIGSGLTSWVSWPSRQTELSFSNSASTSTRPNDSALAITPDKLPIEQALASSKLCFIENRGQVDPRIAYYLKGRDTAVYFGRGGVTFALMNKEDTGGSWDEPSRTAAEPLMSLATNVKASSHKQLWYLKLDFVGANRHTRPVGQDPASTAISYFKGPSNQWKTGLRGFSKLVYPDLWPGIDLIYSGTPNRLKYEFVVKPGADPKRIVLAYRGATGLKVNEAGGLEVATPLGNLEDDAPYSYQQVDYRRVEVPTAYRLLRSSGRSGLSVYGFGVGDYDKSRPLVVDPSMIIYAGLIGGANNDAALHVAVDSAGNAYVVGVTASNPAEGFPVAGGPGLVFTPDRKASSVSTDFFDAFIAKVKADGSGFAYCGYIGGSGDQVATSVAVDSAGNAYIVGATDSRESSFPLTVGPKLTYGGGSRPTFTGNDSFLADGFIAKLNAAGTALIYCGYIGGEGDDFATDVAVDSAGNAYVTGRTTSQSTFPLTVGPRLTFGGGADAFVAKVKPDGTGFAYCGYVGGLGNDRGLGIAVDSAGSAYVTGQTNSDPNSFGAMVGPGLKRQCNDLNTCSAYDAFVGKVKPDGTGLVYLGYIGGSHSDVGRAIAVDSNGNAYITGGTNSDAATFPVSVGPSLTFKGSVTAANAFVAKVNAAGTGLVYCGYIGGTGGEAGTGIAVDAAGNAYVVGSTSSSDFPVTDGSTFKGGSPTGDAFVAKVRADGTGLLYAGYFGGTGDDVGLGIALDPSGNVYICGASSSTDLPAVVGPILTAKGNQDGFIAKLSGLGAPPQPDFSFSFDQATITTSAGSKDPVTINISRVNGFAGNVNISPPADLPRGIKIPLDPSTPVAGNSLGFKIKVKGSAQSGTDLIVFTATDDSGKLVHNATLTLIVQ